MQSVGVAKLDGSRSPMMFDDKLKQGKAGMPNDEKNLIQGRMPGKNIVNEHSLSPIRLPTKLTKRHTVS